MKASNMETSNSAPTSAYTTPLDIDKDGNKCNEIWNYPAVIGMVVYIAQNSRPDITTGYLLMFTRCPLTWVSKIQTQIELYTMESEYISLSQSMKELINIREVLKDVQNFVISGKLRKPLLQHIQEYFV